MARRAAIAAAIAAALSTVLVAGLAAQNGTRLPSRKNGSIAGRVIQSDGAAAEGARVVVYAVREGAPASVVGTATTSDDGRYEVDGLSAGRFAVGVTPQRIRGFGGDSRRITSVPVETFYPGTTDRISAQAITVFDGIPTEGIDIWLEPNAQRYSISGRVTWPEGVSVSNVVIEYGGAEDVHHGVWYVSDPGGLFTIEGASRGTYVLLARADTARGPLVGISATDVANDSVQDLRLTLAAPGSIEGRIVVEGTPVDLTTLDVAARQMLLTLSPVYPSDEGRVDGSGHFTVTGLLGEYSMTVRGMPPGWRVRRVSRAGAVLPEQRVSVGSGEHVTGLEVLIGPNR